MRILITGHLGFVGSYLIQRMESYMGIDRKEGNDILTCDLPNADIVIHLAAEPDVLDSVRRPFKNAETNILGTIRLARRYKTSKFIFASSGGAIQETIESPYGLSKYCAEEYIKMLSDNYVILRFPNIYGRHSRSVIDRFINGPVDIWGDGTSTRTYAHVSDIVDGIIQAMDWEKGLYKLGTDQYYTVKELAEATGKPINYSPKKKGELLHSILHNETPNWKPTIDAINYIKQSICNRHSL